MESLNSEYKGLEKFATCLAGISKVIPQTKKLGGNNTEPKEKVKDSETNP